MAGLGFSFKRITNNQYLIDNKRVDLVNQTSVEPPMVSVTMITYNHERYISQAIEGVMMQKTNFSIKLIIGEDCSTDTTREIVSQYQIQYPNKIILKLPELNLGVNINSLSNKLLCTGKYIAECEGDDYWTDPYKLQKQVDFLEGNSDYVLSFHPIRILEATGKLANDYLTFVPEKHESLEIIAERGNFIQTPSVVFRNCLNQLPKEILLSPAGDYFLYMILAQYGKISQLNETMAIYRHHSGIWSTQSKIKRNAQFCLTLLLLRLYFSEKNPNIALILEKRATQIFRDIAVYLSAEDLKSFRVNNEINIFIDKLIINTIQEYDSDRIIKSKSQKLIKIIFQRIINRITKKIQN